MIVHLIEMANPDGLPIYYSPEAGRASGHGSIGWVTDKNEALGFASAQDAQRFINAALPRQANTMRPAPHRRPDGP